MQFVEGVSRDVFGSIVLCSNIKSPPGRKGFEKTFWPGVEVGLQGWERTHSQGNIAGYESPQAICYAPREVNEYFQRLGIESFIQEFFKNKVKNVDLWLTTVTSAHPRTLRLKEIRYCVEAVCGGQLLASIEASIMIEDKKALPRITVDGPRHELFF